MSILSEPGDLARTPLAAVLLEALNRRATGVLEVMHGGGTSRLWFRDGRPVGAQVFAGFRPLGTMLLQAGLIDIEALSASLVRMAETKRPQGEILVEMGAVSVEAVDRTLAEQQAGYFGVIAALDAAPFLFDESAAVPEWTRGSRLSPGRTIVDALERPQASGLVGSALRPVASAAVRILPTYRDLAGEFRWTGPELALVARLESPARVEAFLDSPGVAPERARAILAALLLLGAAGAEPAAGAAADRGAEDPTEGDRVRETPAPTPPATARRSDPAAARARRQRLLQQAMRNMGVGPFAGGSPDERGADAAAQGGRRGGPDGADADRKLREALLAVAPRAKESDLFARLGIPEGSGRDEVKGAFLALAKQFHPDRFTSPALADVRDVVKDFFSAVNEAYVVLTDERKRAEYLAARKGQAAVNVEGARVDFQKGEACLRTRDFQRARGFLEAAVRADPRPEHQAALAYAYVVDPQRPDRARARKLVQEAIRDPGCDRALYVGGILARDDGDAGTAERYFRAAVKANGRNVDAIRELRLIEARRSSRRR